MMMHRLLWGGLTLVLACGDGKSSGRDAAADAGSDRSESDAASGGSESDAAETGREDAGEVASDASENTDATSELDAEVDPDAGPDAALDGSATASALTLEAYCQAFAAWYHPYLQRCYGSEPYPDERAAGLIAQWTERCEYAAGGVDAGRLSFDGEAAARCAAALPELACFIEFAGLPACQGVFTGNVAVDDACYADETRFFGIFADSCRGGLCLGDSCPQACEALPALGAACLEGRCAPAQYCDADNHCRERIAEGEPCDDAQCAAGLWCAKTQSGRRCLVPLPDGAACGPETACAGPGVCASGVCTLQVAASGPCLSSRNCSGDQHCEIAPDAYQGTCVPPGTTGATCNRDSACAAGYYCATAGANAGTCQPLIAIAMSCAGAGRCVEGAYCRFSDDTPDGVCAARVGDGQDCLVYGNIPEQRACLDGLFCTEDGTCHPQGGASEPCAAFVTGSCAEGLFCSRETGTCLAPAAQGAQCNPQWASTCQAGLGCACGQADYATCASTPRTSTPTDTCQPLLGLGDACKRDAECESKACQTQDNVSYRCVDASGTGLCLGSR